MQRRQGIRADLEAAMSGAGTALAAADQLCRACVDRLDVDGASISVVHKGATRGTFGSSSEQSRWLDELQFTYGEGPCLDAVEQGRPVMVADLEWQAENRWPAFSGTTLESGIRAVFALPVAIASAYVGALDLYRSQRGPLSPGDLSAGMLAAELAALPLLDLMSADVDWESASQGDPGWGQLASLERVEVYQATGMIMEALDVDAAEALVRLRGHAYASGLTASEVAYAVVDRRLLPDAEDWSGTAGPSGTSS